VTFVQRLKCKVPGNAPHPAACPSGHRCADVRSGILPPQSGYRFATAFAGLQTRTPKAAR